MVMEFSFYIIIGCLLFIFLVFLFVAITKRTGFLNFNLNSINQILFSLVTEAEKTLGSGTGQAKLAMVVALFYERYPMLSKWISPILLLKLIETAVSEMNNYVESNINMKKIVTNKVA